MPKNIPRTGKRDRPKTSVKGKRYLCAKCRKRSPKSVKHPAPWYCPRCLAEMAEREELWDAWVPAAHPPVRAMVQVGLGKSCRVEMVVTAAVPEA